MVVAAGAALILAWPTLSGWAIRERYFGVDEVDYYGTLWFYWFVGLREGAGLEDLLHTDLFFYPWGKDIFLHTGSNFLDAIAAIPLLRGLGPIFGYNVFGMGLLALNGLAFYALARRFVARGAALVGAAWFAFTPYALYELAEGRPTQALMAPLCLFLLYAWRTGETPERRAPLLAGLWLAVTGYQYWFYALFAGLSCLTLGLWRTVRPPEGAGSGLAVFGRYALAAGVALTLCAPAIASMLTASSGGDIPGLLDVSAWGASSITTTTQEGQSLSLLVWQPWTLQSGFYMHQAEHGILIGHQRLLSFPLLVMLGVWLWRPGRLARGPTLALAAGALVMATGPLLVIGDGWLPNPIYIGLTKAVSFLQRLWWPSRAFAVIAILAGLAAARVMELASGVSRWLMAGLALWISGLLLMDLRGSGLSPAPSWEPSPPAGYRCLAEGPPGALIELPFAVSQVHLYYQTIHGRPILGGMLEDNPIFSPAEARALRDTNEWLAAVLSVTGRGGPDQPWAEAQGKTSDEKQALYDLGYRYLIVQKDLLPRITGETDPWVLSENLEAYKERLNALAGRPLYEDERSLLYSPWQATPPCDIASLEPDTEPPPLRSRNLTGAVQALPTRALAPLMR